MHHSVFQTGGLRLSVWLATRIRSHWGSHSTTRAVDAALGKVPWLCPQHYISLLWYTPVIPALRRERQDHQEDKSVFGHIANWTPT